MIGCTEYSPLWGNEQFPFFKDDAVTSFWTKFGIKYITQILDFGSLKSFERLGSIISLSIFVFRYFQLSHAFKSIIKQICRFVSQNDLLYKILLDRTLKEGVISLIYRELLTNIPITTREVCLTAWNNDLDVEISRDEWHEALLNINRMAMS